MTINQVLEKQKIKLMDKIKKEIFKATKMHSLLVTYFISFIALDLALILSNSFKLKIQHEIFQVLLTLFNVMLGVLFDTQWSYSVLVYYFSGLFLCVNLFIRNLVCDYQTLTFVFNEFIIGSQIIHIAKKHKFKFTCGFMLYLLIFANFDQKINLNNKITMLAPLVMSFVLLVQFIKEILEIYLNWKMYSIERRFNKITLKLFDLSVFVLTALPLYWAFVSRYFIAFTFFVLLYHIFVFGFYAYNHKKMVFCNLLNKDKLMYRSRMNSLKEYCESFRKENLKTIQFKPEYCSLCSQREVQVIFTPCNHFFLCNECFLRRQIKKSNLCAVCKKQIVYISFLISDVQKDNNFQDIVTTDSQVLLFTYFYLYSNFK